jgi:hypothetical protein
MATMHHIVAVNKPEGKDKGYWTKIGVAFQNRDGSWNLKFEYFPTDLIHTTIQVREPKAREDRGEVATPPPSAPTDDDMPF